MTETQVEALFDGALSITKQGRGWCPGCKKAVMVEVADAKSVVGAIADIVTKIADLPTVAESGERISFVRETGYRIAEVKQAVASLLGDEEAAKIVAALENLRVGRSSA